MKFFVMVVISLLSVGWSIAKADEELVPMVEEGNWIAMEHKTSIVAAPDVCFAANSKARISFRYQDEALEIRVWDQSWSLPAHLGGSIEIQVKDWNSKFDIGGNTAETVAAEISSNVADEMFKTMDGSSSMTVKVGKVVRNVSLAGSTKVTNAFRTCAGLKGVSSVPGSNPFE